MQIWEITLQELSEHAVWYFPMSEDVEGDETTICPATENIALDPNSQIIVRSKFTDAVGSEFFGYLYYGLLEIEYSQPCMFVDNKPVNFWFGITKPKEADLVELKFPIVAVSLPVFGLVAKSIKIDGYGFID